MFNPTGGASAAFAEISVFDYVKCLFGAVTMAFEIADLDGRVGEVPHLREAVTQSPRTTRNVAEASRSLKNVRRDVGDEKRRRRSENNDHVRNAIEGGPVNLQPIQISTAKYPYPKRGVG